MPDYPASIFKRGWSDLCVLFILGAVRNSYCENAQRTWSWWAIWNWKGKGPCFPQWFAGASWQKTIWWKWVSLSSSPNVAQGKIRLKWQPSVCSDETFSPSFFFFQTETWIIRGDTEGLRDKDCPFTMKYTMICLRGILTLWAKSCFVSHTLVPLTMKEGRWRPWKFQSLRGRRKFQKQLSIGFSRLRLIGRSVLLSLSLSLQ